MVRLTFSLTVGDIVNLDRYGGPDRGEIHLVFFPLLRTPTNS